MTIHVLFLGNSLPLKELVKTALKARDCELISATSVALAYYLARKNFPELIVCEAANREDLLFEFLREIRQDAELSTIPVVFVQMKPVDSLVRSEAVALGASRFISPLYGDRDFIPEVAQYLHERKQMRPPETPE